MTFTMTRTTNLRTKKQRVYIDGRRVSERRFNEYDGIGCFFTENNGRVRRFHAVGVKKWWAQ